jgi:hypothetical protein
MREQKEDEEVWHPGRLEKDERYIKGGKYMSDNMLRWVVTPKSRESDDFEASAKTSIATLKRKSL